jgi:Tfp pilus assembly protein PilF
MMEQAVRCAPHNSRAWHLLSRSLSSEADDLRQARPHDEMSADEQKYVETIYSRWLEMSRKAVQIDNLNIAALHALAVAATFGGDYKTAEKMLHRCLQLAPDNVSTYAWGVEFYEEKWLNEPQKQIKIMQAALARPRLFAVFFETFIGLLKINGFTEQSQKLKDSALVRFEKAVQRNPKDAQHRFLLAYLYGKENQVAKALPHYKVALQLDPRNAPAHTLYGNFLQYGTGGGFQASKTKIYDEVEQLYRKAVALDPAQHRALTGLGDFAMHYHNKPAEAGKYYEQAVKLSPDNGFYRANWARWLAKQNRREEAMTEARHAIELGCPEHPVFAELGLNPQTEASR